jgi:hypothetical protein
VFGFDVAFNAVFVLGLDLVFGCVTQSCVFDSPIERCLLSSFLVHFVIDVSTLVALVLAFTRIGE